MATKPSSSCCVAARFCTRRSAAAAAAFSAASRALPTSAGAASHNRLARPPAPTSRIRDAVPSARLPDLSWTCRGRVVDVSRTCRGRVVDVSWTCRGGDVPAELLVPVLKVVSWTCRGRVVDVSPAELLVPVLEQRGRDDDQGGARADQPPLHLHALAERLRARRSELGRRLGGVSEVSRRCLGGVWEVSFETTSEEVTRKRLAAVQEGAPSY